MRADVGTGFHSRSFSLSLSLTQSKNSAFYRLLCAYMDDGFIASVRVRSIMIPRPRYPPGLVNVYVCVCVVPHAAAFCACVCVLDGGGLVAVIETIQMEYMSRALMCARWAFYYG